MISVVGGKCVVILPPFIRYNNEVKYVEIIVGYFCYLHFLKLSAAMEE